MFDKCVFLCLSYSIFFYKFIGLIINIAIILNKSLSQDFYLCDVFNVHRIRYDYRFINFMGLNFFNNKFSIKLMFLKVKGRYIHQILVPEIALVSFAYALALLGQSLSRTPETRSAPPVQPRRPLPAGRRTRMSLPCNSDARLSSASPCSLVWCMRAASFSWTPLRPFSVTGLPGAALSCSYLAPWSFAGRGRGHSASTFSASRPSSLCRSAWCHVLLLSSPPSPGEPSCSPRLAGLSSGGWADDDPARVSGAPPIRSRGPRRLSSRPVLHDALRHLLSDGLLGSRPSACGTAQARCSPC
jgi:hypothetical protein